MVRGCHWMHYVYMMLFVSWECSAAKNKRTIVQHRGSVRNFRHIARPLSSPVADWEIGLREALHQALLREHYHDSKLHERLLRAPIIGKQNTASPFGDIAVLARGQFYGLSGGNFALVQDPYSNDCDECHNVRRNCGSVQCEVWRPQHHERLLALWTVKRLRHRTHDDDYRYEIEYTVSPMTATFDEAFVTRNGRFDYAIPGHVFIIRNDPDGRRPTTESFPEVYNRKIPHEHFRSEVLIATDSNGNKHFLHSYPGFYTSLPVHPTKQDYSTTDRQEVELYRKLIEALAAKTSTTKEEGGPYKVSLNDFDRDIIKPTYGSTQATTKEMTLLTPIPMPVKVQYPEKITQLTPVTTPTLPIKLTPKITTEKTSKSTVTHPIKTTLPFFTPLQNDSITTKMIKKATSTQTTQRTTTTEENGGFLFPEILQTTTKPRKKYKPTKSKVKDTESDFLFTTAKPTKGYKNLSTTTSFYPTSTAKSSAETKTTTTSPLQTTLHSTTLSSTSAVTTTSLPNLTKYSIGAENATIASTSRTYTNPTFMVGPKTTKMRKPLSTTKKINFRKQSMTKPEPRLSVKSSSVRPFSTTNPELSSSYSKIAKQPPTKSTSNSIAPKPTETFLKSEGSATFNFTEMPIKSRIPTSQFTKVYATVTQPPVSEYAQSPQTRFQETTIKRVIPTFTESIPPPPQIPVTSAVSMNIVLKSSTKSMGITFIPSTQTTSESSTPFSTNNTKITDRINTPKHIELSPSTTVISKYTETLPLQTPTMLTTMTTFFSTTALIPTTKSIEVITVPTPPTSEVTSRLTIPPKTTPELRELVGTDFTLPLSTEPMKTTESRAEETMNQLPTPTQETEITMFYSSAITRKVGVETTKNPVYKTTVPSDTSKETEFELSRTTANYTQTITTEMLKTDLAETTKGTEETVTQSITEMPKFTKQPGVKKTTQLPEEKTESTVHKTDGTTEIILTKISDITFPAESTTVTKSYTEPIFTEQATTPRKPTEITPSKPTTPKATSIPKTTSATADTFLTNGDPMNEPILVKPVSQDYGEDDIFGTTKSTTQSTKITTVKFTESDLAIQLFDRARKRNLDNPRIIFSNFYEPSSTTGSTPMATTPNETDVDFQPLTSQSVETSISFEVNKRKKPEGDKAYFFPTKASMDEVVMTSDGYTVYKSEFPKPNPADEDSKKHFDDIAMVLVNHARTIDYLSRKETTSVKPKYKRRPNYIPKKQRRRKQTQ